MSALFDITSAQGDYRVEIRSGLLMDVFSRQSQDVIIADAFFDSYLKEAGCKYLTIEANESVKNLAAIPDLIVRLRQLGCNRSSRLVAFGGGIVQDVVSFIASIYMRGIPWTYIPSTLLSMTDSCIGGKSSINVGEFKNIVGTFHVPQAVLIDPVLVQTLSAEQKIAGLIEAVKICYCRSFDNFERYLSYQPGLDMKAEDVERVIVESLASKKWFIEIDEFDRKERLLLNLGHTFGHAIEGASHFAVSHGIAVGLGILIAIEIGSKLGRPTDNPLVGQLKQHVLQLLTGVPTLEQELKLLLVPDLLERFAADKKHRDDFYVIVDFTPTGEVALIKLPKNTDTNNAIAAAFSEIIRRFTNEV